MLNIFLRPGPLFSCLVLVLSGLAAGAACDPNPAQKIPAKGSGGGPGSGGVTSSGGVTGSGGDVGSGSGGAVGTGSGGQTGADSGGATGLGGSEGGSSGSGAAGQVGGGTDSGGAAGLGGAGGRGATDSGGTTGGGGQAGENLIKNGDFSMGEMFWKVDTSVMHSITDGAECLRMMGGSPVTNLGWPADVGSALNLPSGTTYRLSYKVSSTGPLVITLQPKVGMAVTPYTADFPVGGAVSDPVGTTAQTFTHMFTVQTADTKAGLALSVAAAAGMTSQMSTVCFDDVSLVRQ